jgi:hypothetical protein
MVRHPALPTPYCFHAHNLKIMAHIFGLNATKVLIKEDPEAELMPVMESAAPSSTIGDNIDVSNGYAVSGPPGDMTMAEMENSGKFSC